MSFKGLKILSLMQRWGSKREMMGDDPPYLAVGTEVSAKYKGAFCEAKVRKIVRSVKCKIAYKLGLGTAIVTDDQIKGTLRAGSVVEVKHADKKEYVEATIIKIQDCSQYTVVFDDGDITTLRRTALCLKSGRHFAESETLDQLPLTHPEHFGNPVMGGRRGRRNRADDSSDDEDSIKKAKQPKEEKEADIGKVVCVEISEKKKQKDNWFPGLVVAPTAQDTVKINVKEDYLVRSFKDGRYYTVPKKEATPFTREIGQKVDNNTLRTAVEKALLFLDKDELPPHWDRELLFGLNEITDTDSDAAFDSDTSDDEPREEKDHFVAQLYKFMDDRGTPINKGPTINGRDVDLYKLFKVVHKLGGYNRVTNHNQWKTVSHKLGFGQNPTSINLVKHAYKKFLHSFEDFYRKLGCTMVNHPRGQRPRQRSNRSLIRDKDKALPSKEKQGEKDGEENKDSPLVEPVKEKENTPKEEPKPKEVILESLKPQRETRKESQRPKSEKLEKKDDIKILPSASKINEPPMSKVVKEDKIKSDDREERIKLRDIVKLDSNIKDEPKTDKDSVSSKVAKEIKSEESLKLIKSTRRDAKEIKKEEKEDKNKSLSNEREIRHKKTSTSNPVEIKNSTEGPKVKKSRSLFSKITGSKRIKPLNDQSKIPRTNKPVGLNSVRQKRTFSERMKAMVKKFKIKTGVKHLRHKSPTLPNNKECEDKKKSNPEESTKVAVPQLTRSKSREEFSCKLRKPESAQEKKPTTHPPTQQLNPDKKQIHTKKRKEDEKSSASINDEPLDILPNYKTVTIGDKLKVYYGPTHESKVTYEAKVLNLKEEDHEVLFLVHYTGWNTRYDEWIKRGRIADNLSWTPGRAKRTRQQLAQHSSQQKPVVKRSKSGGDMISSGGGGGGPRSTTPSSVTSSSSRTKSPAVSNAPRIMRSRTRTRRTSGHTHTDFSESEMDDDYDSDETEGAQGFNGKEASIDQRLSSDEKESKDVVREILMEKMKGKTYRPAHRRRMESGGETDDATMEHKKIKDESEEEGRFEKTRSRSEKRKSEEVCKAGSSISDDMKKDSLDVLRSDRLRNKRKVVEEKMANESSDERETKQEVSTDDCNTQKASLELKDKSEFDKLESEIQDVDGKRKLKRKVDEFEDEIKESQSNERRRSKRVTPRKEESKPLAKDEDDQPKGREFDLNQIRSELKGITTANKVIVDVVALSDKEDDIDDNIDDEEDDNIATVNENEFKTITDSTLDDIYEFKEPEPFEFEVRSKCGDDKGSKIQRRSFGRVCDENNSTSPASVRKKLTGMKSESPTSFENKKIILQSSIKSDDEEVDKDSSESQCDELKNDFRIELKKSPSPISQKNESLPEKLEATTKRLVSNKTEEIIQPLSLFSDLPDDEEEQGVDEDSRGRLVISEHESESESQEPLFSHQQRNHEDFFPTSITQSSSVENSQNKCPFSGFSDKLKEEDRDKNDDKKYEETRDDDNEDVENNDDVETEDDPIISAIQRALSQSTEEEDSNDVDLLSELPEPAHKKDDDLISLAKGHDSASETSQESDESQNEDNAEAQMSQSIESDDNDQLEISTCKIIEEVNLESNDSEPDLTEDKEMLEIDDETENSQPVIIEPREEVDKEAESQDSINIITVEEEGKEEDVEEVCEHENVSNNEDESEGEQECIMKEEVVEESQSNETIEIDNGDMKVDVEEVTEQVEMDEEIVLEAIEMKKEGTEFDKDECAIPSLSKEEECETEEIVDELNELDMKGAEIKEEGNEVEETDTNLESLLCEETIPGSPAPSSSIPVDSLPSSSPPELPFASAASAHPVIYKAPQPPTLLPPPLPPPPLPPPPAPTPLVVNEAAPVMENTPPTTPESSLSPISNSPRGERSGSSPIPENESSKSNRDSSEVDMEGFSTATKIGHYSEEDTNCGVGNTNVINKKTGHHEEVETQGIKKRRRSHKRCEENVKRMKMTHRSPRHAGSDSDDDTSENSLDLLSLHSRSPRPSKYNFFVQLDPELDASQRIAVLQQKLSELRKTYMSVKAELAGIDRRRKKLRRREREASVSVKTSVKSEVPCS